MVCMWMHAGRNCLLPCTADLPAIQLHQRSRAYDIELSVRDASPHTAAIAVGRLRLPPAAPATTVHTSVQWNAETAKAMSESTAVLRHGGGRRGDQWQHTSRRWDQQHSQQSASTQENQKQRGQRHIPAHLLQHLDSGADSERLARQSLATCIVVPASHVRRPSLLTPRVLEDGSPRSCGWRLRRSEGCTPLHAYKC